MPRPRVPDPIVEQIEAPTYETECRRIATYLRRKAEPIADLPVMCVMISPELALWIASRLDNHSDDVEQRLG